MVRHRGSSLLFALIALAVAICSRPTYGQTISFLRPLSSVPLSNGVVVPLHAGAVAADASGVYVVGDIGLAKYDSHGNELWTRPIGQIRKLSPARTVLEQHSRARPPSDQKPGERQAGVPSIPGGAASASGL